MRSYTAIALALLVVAVPATKSYACTCDRPVVVVERTSCCAKKTTTESGGCPGRDRLWGDCPCTKKTPQASAPAVELLSPLALLGEGLEVVTLKPALRQVERRIPLRIDPHPEITLPLLI